MDINKFRAKSRYRKHIGFRAQLTDLKILKINS
jgi:ribosomal protein L21